MSRCECGSRDGLRGIECDDGIWRQLCTGCRPKYYTERVTSPTTIPRTYHYPEYPRIDPETEQANLENRAFLKRVSAWNRRHKRRK